MGRPGHRSDLVARAASRPERDRNCTNHRLCTAVEDYPTDPRGPSALALGHSATGRALHAVCALDPSGTLVITVYEPAMPWWLNERTRKPQP